MGDYLLCCLLLNGGIFVLLRTFFKSGARPIYFLNHSLPFAHKYFALALALLLIETVIEKLFGNKLCEKFAPFIDKLPLSFKKCGSFRGVKAAVFSAGIAVFVIYLNFMMQPVWTYATYNPVHGIYIEPANTLQALFLGSSHVHFGVSPMALYERYGIPAYDIATDGQPVAASFFWLKEIYRCHSESLDTVILDVSTLKREPGDARYHKAIDFMHFSSNKLCAVKSYSGNFSELLVNSIPLLSYHERWKELSRRDVAKFFMEPQVYLRGYFYHTSRWIRDADDFSKIVTPIRILDQYAEDMVLNEKSVKYFRKMADFCEGHDLRLLLIKIPTNWSSAFHNAVQALADEYGLDFLDFNVEPYYSKINFNLAANVITPPDINNLHLNYYGAAKLTDYLGKYLIEKCGARDVRGDPKYAFMEEQLADYHRHIISAPLAEFTDPCEYIKYVLDREKYTIFISVKDDAAHSLTNEQRSYFESIGLTELSDLKDNASYLAVVEDGKVMKEITDKNPSDGTTGKPVSYPGKTSDKTSYRITSGGRNSGDTSSITIGRTERSPNKRGLNIAIYDNKMHKYVANAVFDTHAAPLRPIQNVEQRLKAELEAGATLPELTGVDRTLYLYNRRCEDEMKKALARNAVRQNDLPSYLVEFLDDEKLEIYLTAKSDVTGALTDEAREKLRDFLPKLAELKSAESYVAAISGGKITAEKSASESTQFGTDKYLLRSGKRDGSDISTLMIDGKNYMDETEGLHVVIYDTLTQLVVDSVTFGAPCAEETAQ